MEIGLQDAPFSMLLQRFVHPDREANYVGQRLRIAHLTSERGRALNGKICRVENFDRKTQEARLHCVVEGDETSGEVIKLKSTNLVPLEAAVLENFMSGSAGDDDESRFSTFDFGCGSRRWLAESLEQAWWW